MRTDIAGWCASACVLLASAPAEMARADTAAIIFASGQSNLTTPEGKSARLRKGQQVAIGHLIRTGATGRVQIRFRDGTFISMHGASDLRVDAFRYRAEGEPTDLAQFTLFRGSVRFMPGGVGKHRGGQFRIATAVAGLELHGSEVYTAMGDALELTVGTGRVDIRNDGGALTATQGQRVLVRDRRTAPLVIGTLVPYPILPEAR